VVVTKRGKWKRLDKALQALPPANDVEREKAREELADNRLLGRQVAHGAKVRLTNGSYDWGDGGEERWRTYEGLLDQLVKDYGIDDRDGLAGALEMATLIYRDGRAALDRKDEDQLLAAIPKVTGVLSREGNDRRIAQILTDRDARDMRGKLWHRGKHVTTTQVDTIQRVWQITAGLDQLKDALRAQRKRQPDIGLHRTVLFLERYWEKSTGRKVTRGFGDNDPAKGRRPAKSEAMKFLETVIGFVAPNDVRKLYSATRRRLSGLAK
jgi:hypothetical protein